MTEKPGMLIDQLTRRPVRKVESMYASSPAALIAVFCVMHYLDWPPEIAAAAGAVAASVANFAVAYFTRERAPTLEG